MTSPSNRIESHPHEAKLINCIDHFSFSCSYLNKKLQQNKPKLKKHKSELLPKWWTYFWNFTQGRRFFVYIYVPIFEILVLLFDISKTKANDTFNYWLDILRDILPRWKKFERIENNMKITATSWQNTS